MRDGLDFFRLCIHSVLSFTDWPHQIFVVDNQSSPKTKLYLHSLKKNYPINVLHYDQPFNFAAEVNLGLDEAFKNVNVRYGIILNADTVVTPGWVSAFVRTFGTGKKIGAVGPLSNIAIPEQELSYNSIRYGIKQAKNLSGFCMAVARHAYEYISGFEEGFEGGGYEDRDFVQRLIDNNFQVLINREIYIHHFWKAFRSNDPGCDVAMRLNQERFFRIHPHLKLIEGGKLKYANV